MTFLPKLLTRPPCPLCGGAPRSKGHGIRPGQRRWYCEPCHHGFQVPPSGPRKVSRVRGAPPPRSKLKRDSLTWKEQKESEMRLKSGKGKKRGAVACSDGTTGHFWELDERPSGGRYRAACRKCGSKATAPAFPTMPFEAEGHDYAI